MRKAATINPLWQITPYEILASNLLSHPLEAGIVQEGG